MMPLLIAVFDGPMISQKHVELLQYGKIIEHFHPLTQSVALFQSSTSARGLWNNLKKRKYKSSVFEISENNWGSCDNSKELKELIDSTVEKTLPVSVESR